MEKEEHTSLPPAGQPVFRAQSHADDTALQHDATWLQSPSESSHEKYSHWPHPHVPDWPATPSQPSSAGAPVHWPDAWAYSHVPQF